MGDFDRFRPLPVSECLQLPLLRALAAWSGTALMGHECCRWHMHSMTSESSFGHRFAVLSPSLRIRTQLPSKSMRSTKL